MAFTTGPNPHFVAAADFNEDGLLDLAATNADLPNAGTRFSSVAILLATSPGSYSGPTIYPVDREPHGIVAADFNGDGILDLATANKYGANVSVLIGKGNAGIGDGTFGPAVHYPAGGLAFFLVTGDFNEDGALDLAVSLNSTSAVSVLLGNASSGAGDGSFGSPALQPLTSTATGIEIGDFNEDDILDLIATENDAGTVGVLLGLGSGGVGTGSFAPASHFACGLYPFDIALGDFDEDGISDLAVANGASAGTTILRGGGSAGQGNGTFAAWRNLPSGNTAAVDTIDANRDGITDIVAGNFTGTDQGSVLLFLGAGTGGVGDGTFGSAIPLSIGADPYQLTVADVTHDGQNDLLVAAALRDFVAVLPGTCSPAAPDPRSPVLTDVRDVPNDQGGFVFLTWSASSLDVTGGPVTSYRIWRRVHATFTEQARSGEHPSPVRLALPSLDGSATTEYWEAVATLPAQRLVGYGYTAATTEDSTRFRNVYTAFFVSALTQSIDQFFSSDVDSGYSVDNLPPRRPLALTGEFVPGAGLRLIWEPNLESDLFRYHVYRGTSEEFVPSPENWIATATEPAHLDAEGTGAFHYKVTAVDVHGNEGEAALLRPSQITDSQGPMPSRLALAGSVPNPVRAGNLSVAFELPLRAAGRLHILDIAGREVASRDLTPLAAGRHLLLFPESAPLAAGIYLIRMEHGGRVLETKAIVIR